MPKKPVRWIAGGIAVVLALAIAAGLVGGRALRKPVACGAPPLQTWDAGASDVPLTFAPDGRIVAAGGAGESVHLWEIGATGSGRAVSSGAGRATALAFAPDGLTLAIGTFDGTVRLVDIASAAVRRTLLPDGGAARSAAVAVAVSEDGGLVAAGTRDGRVRVWARESGVLVATVAGHPVASGAGDAWVTDLIFAPGGRTLIIGYGDDTVATWEPGGGGGAQLREGPLHGRGGGALTYALQTSGDGRLVANAGGAVPLMLWRAEDGQVVRQIAADGKVGRVALDGTGRRVAFGLEIWPPPYDEPPPKELLNPRSCWPQRPIAVRDVADDREVARFSGHRGVVFGLAFSPDARLLASSGADNIVRLWQIPVP